MLPLDESQRKQVVIEKIRIDPPDDHMNLDNYFNYIKNILKEHGNKMFHYGYTDNSEYMSIYITNTRPETDNEMVQRIEKENYEKHQLESREKQLLRELKKKYGG